MKSSVFALAAVVLVACVYTTYAAPFAKETRSGVPPAKLLFAAIAGANPKANGVGGGVNCAACTILVSLIEQYAYIHDQPILNAFEELCTFLPAGIFQTVCNHTIEIYGPIIINSLELRQTPDRVCQELRICTNDTCRLFPAPTEELPLGFNEKMGIKLEVPASFNPMEWINRFVQYHEPLIDLDGDDFSTISTLRGVSWRGRDCDDFKASVYPGRKTPYHGPNVDYNCNGIYGADENGVSYEEKFCNSTAYYGTAILGDSAAAHFHCPPQWVTPEEINSSTFDDLIDILANEIDWPMMSATTGFQTQDWIGQPRGPVQSQYLLTLQQNLCTHRDYQNIGVNGARTSSMADSIMYGFHRDQQNDYPVILNYALIGNDVCNSHPGLSHMTTPEEFYNNVVTAMNYLDTVLPMGSYVVFMGLADGRVLWDAMNARIHPIGKLRQDVTYADLYNYLNCLEISPCWGWLNSDEYWRNQTSYRAFNLSATYQEVIRKHQYKHFNMTYTNCPVKEVMEEWEAKGGQNWQLIEPVDGFHPNQIGNAIISQHQWNLFKEKYPYLIPPVNPNNAEIKKIFNTQGGY